MLVRVEPLLREIPKHDPHTEHVSRCGEGEVHNVVRAGHFGRRVMHVEAADGRDVTQLNVARLVEEEVFWGEVADVLLLRVDVNQASGHVDTPLQLCTP